MVYTIPKEFLDDMLAKLKPVTNKLEKAGVPYQLKVLDNTEREVEVEVKRQKHMVRVIDVLYEQAGTYKIKGYTVVAVLEHTGKGVNLVYLVGNIKLTQEQVEMLHHLPPRCQHCNTNRQRKKTVILWNQQTGGMIQVGLSCLDDYTGMEVTTKLIKFTDIERAVGKILEDFTTEHIFSGHNDYYICLDDFLVACMLSRDEAIEEKGFNYWGKYMAYDILKNIMFYMDDQQKFEKSAEYREKAYQIIAFYRGLEYDPRESFRNNLKALCESGILRRKNYKLAVWILLSYENEILKQKRQVSYKEMKKLKEEQATGEFLGDIGDTVDTLEVVGMNHKTVEFYAGGREIYRIQNDCRYGNCRLQWTSDYELLDGKHYTLKGGRIKTRYIGTFGEKGNETYEKVTVITRCKMIASSDDEAVQRILARKQQQD